MHVLREFMDGFADIKSVGGACHGMNEPNAATREDVPRTQKPFLSPEELVDSMKARGITFCLCSEADAVIYLRHANNYLRCASYRVLFDRRQPAREGGGLGDYVNLDFGHLRDLSSLDRELREVFLQICIDVEHFAKMYLLDRALGEDEDGYIVVADYIRSVSHGERGRLSGAFVARAREGGSHDAYTGDLIARYLEGLPLWVFLEVVEFGRFIDFYRFCSVRWEDDRMLDEHYILKSVKGLRNACAHNSCIINGFVNGSRRPGTVPHRPITDALNAAGLGNSKSRRSKLGNVRIMQMASALWALDRFCACSGTRQRDSVRLEVLRARFEESRQLYSKCNAVTSYFDFLWKIVDTFLPVME